MFVAGLEDDPGVQVWVNSACCYIVDTRAAAVIEAHARARCTSTLVAITSER